MTPKDPTPPSLELKKACVGDLLDENVNIGGCQYEVCFVQFDQSLSTTCEVQISNSRANSDIVHTQAFHN